MGLREVTVETRSLNGLVAVITGATSGIGAACARSLTEAGALVVCSGRRKERLDSLVAELGREQARGVEMDVRDPAGSRRLVSEALAAFGRVDALVANAGIGAYGGVLDHSDDFLAAMIDTNVGGTVWPIRAVLPGMLERGDGDIVIIASVAGLRGGGHEAIYAATKFAQVGLAGALDRELAPKGVRVTSICPASTRTEFAIGYGRQPDMPGMDDWLDPDDVAGAVVTVLRQPRRLRTQLWTMWPMVEVS